MFNLIKTLCRWTWNALVFMFMLVGLVTTFLWWVFVVAPSRLLRRAAP